MKPQHPGEEKVHESDHRTDPGRWQVLILLRPA